MKKNKQPCIVGTLLPKNKTITFKTIEEASEFTHISVQRIRHCIETGMKWWQWVFDEELV